MQRQACLWRREFPDESHDQKEDQNCPQHLGEQVSAKSKAEPDQNDRKEHCRRAADEISDERAASDFFVSGQNSAVESGNRSQQHQSGEPGNIAGELRGMVKACRHYFSERQQNHSKKSVRGHYDHAATPQQSAQLLSFVTGPVNGGEADRGFDQPQGTEGSEEPNQRNAERVDAQHFCAKDPGKVDLENIPQRHAEQRPGKEHAGVARDVSDLRAKLLRPVGDCVRQHGFDLIIHDVDLAPAASGAVNHLCNIAGSAVGERFIDASGLS